MADTYKLPESARNNARRVLRWREEYGDQVRGMTEVGWRRARQLAENESVGIETVRAMSAFNRHRQNAEVAPEYKDTPWRDAGYVAWLGWGGTTGIDWARGITGADEKNMNTTENNALKAISSTDTELRVGNYMVLFGGRDLEGVMSPRRNQDGSAGEYFTKSTAFDSQYTDVDLLAVDWEHGHRELGKDEVLGRVDWKTARVDDKGLFVERVLNRRNRYVKYLEELIEAGLIGNSSEAVIDGVEKAPNGEIVRWPLRRDTLTVTPMEPRMISENAITAIKALSERYPALKSLLPAENVSDAETVEPKTDGESVVAVADDTERRRIEIELELLAI